MAPKTKPELLVVGAQFTGSFVAREMKAAFNVTVVDAKEYMEYTPGILRAYVKPMHYESMSFLLSPVLEKKMRVRFIFGEVKKLDFDRDLDQICIEVKRAPPNEEVEKLNFDYAVICSGCNFGPNHAWGESLWSPTVVEEARRASEWGKFDERFYEERRRHILEEHEDIRGLNERSAKVLVVGAGFIGVEWVTELQYHFDSLQLTVLDFMPQCLGPLPQEASDYCSRYMKSKGIKQHYNLKFDPKNSLFWAKIDLPEPDKADKMYSCAGVKASNFFMPKEVLSDYGPNGGGWIHFNMKLQVILKPPRSSKDNKNPPPLQVWANGRAYAVGDCNIGSIGSSSNWSMPPIPKIAYPGEEQAFHACRNIRIMHKRGNAANPDDPSEGLKDTWWPWGAGIYVTSLGVKDACSVRGATHMKNTGKMVRGGCFAALQKDLIERTKVMECKDKCLGKVIWYFVHRTPINLWGKGPWCP